MVPPSPSPSPSLPPTSTRSGGASAEGGGDGRAAKTVPPTIPSGVARRKAELACGFAFLAVVYRVVLTWGGKAKAAAQFCPTNEPCPRPDLLAFQVCSGMMQLYMGLTGLTSWHIARTAHTSIPRTPEGRLFGYVAQADYLNVGILVYQTFDFVASLGIPEHRTAVFLTHHALAALTAYFSLEFQLVHHYAIFFGGCSEISSIFLVLCDYDVYFPASHGTTWSAIIFFCQVSFTFAFLYYRIVGWYQVSVPLWRDVYHVLGYSQNGDSKVVDKDGGRGKGEYNCIAEQFRPGKSWFLKVFLAMDVLLGLLQIYWFVFGILPKIVEILSS